MKKQKAAWFLVTSLLTALLAFAPAVWAQDNAQPALKSDPQNIQAYIDLLRADIRQQKGEMTGAVKELSAADAAKFWPIYEEYDAELAKLNDERVVNIQEYASSYDQMTDDKADELVHKASLTENSGPSSWQVL